MPNHLEHPEDTILTGDLSVLDWFITPGNLSVKIDGSPSVGFGINPATGKFAVATKSFLNKKKIKIAHSYQEIDTFYDGEVAVILHYLFDYAPRQHSVWIQADWIGFGGDTEYVPNTITYKFPEVIQEKIIIFPHTIYCGTNNLNTCESFPINFQLESTSDCKVIQPKSYIVYDQDAFYDVGNICNFARQMSTTCNFVQGKQLAELKKQLSTCIREEREIKPEEFNCDPNLIRFWKLVKSIKEDCLFLCRNNGPEAYLGYDRIDSEGYVMDNKYGMYKLVNREVFSHANFNTQKNWCK
jgi:hypothetical protein